MYAIKETSGQLKNLRRSTKFVVLVCDPNPVCLKEKSHSIAINTDLFQQYHLRLVAEVAAEASDLFYIQNILFDVLCNRSFDRFRISTVHYINLFPILKVVERRNRSYTFPFHQFRCFWGRISNYFTKNGITVLITKFFKFWSNNLAGTTPSALFRFQMKAEWKTD